MLLKGSVVHQGIEAAQLPGGILHGAAAKLGIGYVTRDQDRPAALGLHGPTSLLCILMFAQIDDGNIGPFASIQDCHRPADPRVAASNQCHHARELLGAAVFGSLVLRSGLQLTLPAGLLEVLLGKGWLWVAPAACLHRTLLLGVSRLCPPPGFGVTLQLPV